MTNSKRSESLRTSAILAFSGGFMDAYSYICRGEVFANAQTGNMLLCGISIFEQQYSRAMQYFIPIILFGFGVFIVDMIRWKVSHKKKIHWRQIIIILEILLFILVSFIPLEFNLLANSLTSFVCGMQVEAFRKTHGNAVATTMCIGNLRSGIENFSKFIIKKDITYLSKSILYFLLISCFIFGAIVGNFFVGYLAIKAILICSISLIFVFIFIRE